MTPTAELLDLPKEYGRATRKLAWATVRAELERATQYWIATSRPHGRAHVVPLDGLWLDDVWYYGGSERAVHYRNVLANPDVVMHLPDPVKAVIVEGDARLAHPSPELAQRSPRRPRRSTGTGRTPAATGARWACTRARCAPGPRSPRTPPGSGSREAARVPSSSSGWTPGFEAVGVVHEDLDSHRPCANGRGSVPAVLSGSPKKNGAPSTVGPTTPPRFHNLPKVKQAIVPDDAIATGKALRALGFKVRWELIELNPTAGPDDPATKQTRIVEPSPGMVVLSVLGPNAEDDSVDPFTDTLMVEVMTSREVTNAAS